MSTESHEDQLTSDGTKFHFDKQKGLARQFPAEFPRNLFESKGTWQIDALAGHAPWREIVAPDEAITFSRLAVHRAWLAAEAATGRIRGKFEARAVLQHGYPDGGENIIRQLWIAAANPENSLSESELSALILAELHVETLGAGLPPKTGEDGTCPGLAAWLETLDHYLKVSSGPGRASTFEFNAFFQLLVGFWDRNMSVQAPMSRRPSATRRTTRVGFHEFANAAAHDAGCINATLGRAISRAVVEVRRREKLAG